MISLRQHKEECPTCGAVAESSLWDLVKEDGEVLATATYGEIQAMYQEMLDDAD